MKKTLEEEKERILEISRKINEQDELSNTQKYNDTLKDIANSGYNETGDEFIKEGEPLNLAIVEFIDALESKGVNRDMIYQELMSTVQAAIEGDKNNRDEEEPYDPPTLRYRDTGGTEGG